MFLSVCLCVCVLVRLFVSCIHFALSMQSLKPNLIIAMIMIMLHNSPTHCFMCAQRYTQTWMNIPKTLIGTYEVTNWLIQ